MEVQGIYRISPLCSLSSLWLSCTSILHPLGGWQVHGRDVPRRVVEGFPIVMYIASGRKWMGPLVRFTTQSVIQMPNLFQKNHATSISVQSGMLVRGHRYETLL